MKKIIFKIDVDTYRGTKKGVPRLVNLLQKYKVGATFLFSLGPDHTGRALRRIFKPGFFKKVQRTSVFSHYGLKTLLYGVLLPGPHIGKKCADVMRQVKQAGFEVGVHTFDHIKWQDYVKDENATWTNRELQKAYDIFVEVFAEKPKTFGAAGWQMNKFGLKWLSQHFAYTSDSRGFKPFFPVWEDEAIPLLQIPTTLPTMDELVGVNGITETNIAEHLLSLTKNENAWGHVFTLHAELEGMKMLPALEAFIQGLKIQGYEILSMQNYFQALDLKQIAKHTLEYKEIPGRSGILLTQGQALP